MKNTTKRALSCAAVALASQLVWGGNGQNFSQENSTRSAFSPNPKPMNQEEFKNTVSENMDAIKSLFNTQYAPGIWKTSINQWNLDELVENAKTDINNKPNANLNDFRKTLIHFFGAVKDYHTQVRFHCTESATLPITVVCAEDRFFLGWIDRKKAPEAQFPFQPGDELVSLDGINTGDVVNHLQKNYGGNSPLADRALTTLRLLTKREAAVYGDVCKGPVKLGIRPKGAQTVTEGTLTWDYRPELIPDLKMEATPRRAEANKLEDLRMYAPLAARGTREEDNPFQLDSKCGFVPTLGPKLSGAPKSNPFHAYTYQNAAGRTIGYIRIPSYIMDDNNVAAQEFSELIKRYQKETDALVIDQVNNSGGSILFLYALCGMLTDKPLATPKYYQAITQEDIVGVYPKLELNATTDEEAQKLFGKTASGYPITATFAKQFKQSNQFMLDEWKAGKTLMGPFHLYGIDQIPPSAVANYTKPILILVNELSFSAGDLFPAIMQDNQRAKLFGVPTAGAGCTVKEFKFANCLGVATIDLSTAIALRKNDKPLENAGVQPDFPYAIKASDIQGEFKGYAAAVNEAVNHLLK